MRKVLMLTSALGLLAPTLAMAGASAGSSAAACGSGFFAQIDAKIMNAKLEIKNEKGSKSTVDADAPESDDDVRKALVNGDLDKLAGFAWKVRFGYGAGATRGTFLNDVLTAAGTTVGALAGKTEAEIAEVIRTAAVAGGAAFAAPANLNAPTADELGRLLRGWAGHVFSTAANDAAAAPEAKKLIQELKELADEAKLNKQANGVNLDAALTALGSTGANKIAVIEVLNNQTIVQAATVALPVNILTLLSPDLVTSANVLVLGDGIDGATFNDAAAQKAVKDLVTPDAYRTAALAQTQANADYNQRVVQQAASNVKLNAQLAERKKLEVIDRRVHHHALAGGVGATVGWWQNLGGFALSISGTGDYLWGTFRTVDDKSGSTTDAAGKRKLGFGFQGDVGVHYIVSPSTTLGVLVGLRGQQLNIGRDKGAAAASTSTSKDSKGDYASKWMINPVVSAQMRTFFNDNVYGALTVGYVIPIEKDYKLENTNITNKDAKIRFQGLTGAFSVGMVF